MAQKKRTNDIYAIKVLRKTDMIQKNQVRHVKAERNILARTQVSGYFFRYPIIFVYVQSFIVHSHSPTPEPVCNQDVLCFPIARFLVFGNGIRKWWRLFLIITTIWRFR